MHSLPWHIAGRTAHFDMDLDAADALCEQHCSALHAVHAEQLAELLHWNLTCHPPPVLLTVSANRLGTVNAWEAHVIVLTHSGGYGGERSADAGQGCPCQGPPFEGWMPSDQAPASEGHYESSHTAQHTDAVRITQGGTVQAQREFKQ